MRDQWFHTTRFLLLNVVTNTLPDVKFKTLYFNGSDFIFNWEAFCSSLIVNVPVCFLSVNPQVCVLKSCVIPVCNTIVFNYTIIIVIIIIIRIYDLLLRIKLSISLTLKYGHEKIVVNWFLYISITMSQHDFNTLKKCKREIGKKAEGRIKKHVTGVKIWLTSCLRSFLNIVSRLIKFCFMFPWY